MSSTGRVIYDTNNFQVAVNNVVTRFTSDFQYMRGLHQVNCFSLHLFFFVSFEKERGGNVGKKRRNHSKKKIPSKTPCTFKSKGVHNIIVLQTHRGLHQEWTIKTREWNDGHLSDQVPIESIQEENLFFLHRHRLLSFFIFAWRFVEKNNFIFNRNLSSVVKQIHFEQQPTTKTYKRTKRQDSGLCNLLLQCCGQYHWI